MPRAWISVWAVLCSCGLVRAQIYEPPLTTERVVGSLQAPLYVTAPPGDTSRLFVIEREGRVRIIRDGEPLPDPFLDITARVVTGGERGLFSMAFHPDYVQNGYFFVFYTSPDIVIARFTVSTNPDRADLGSAITVLTYPHPEINHNAGQLQFGPRDGYLYIGTADGIDPNASQDPAQLAGKILRLDVNRPPPYIPPSNPFVGPADPRDEIWAMGVRNPWRFSFDRLTSDLYIGDVGSSLREEVNFQSGASRGGENYGWPCFEGELTKSECIDPPSAPRFPIVQYSHSSGCAVMGGYVYRGSMMPWLHGTYFYADYCGFVRSFRLENGAVTNARVRTPELSPDGGDFGCVSFGEDAAGELYCLSGSSVYKIVPAPSDCNQNSVDDLVDVAAATSPDCNANRVPDECEVRSPGSDRNNNGIPDLCDALRHGDRDGDGDVDARDFAAFQRCFNGSTGSPVGPLCAGFDVAPGNGRVDLADLVWFLMAFRGPT